MYNQKTREWWKHVLWISRVKLLYARITLTRFTTIYFFIALLSCVTLVFLQCKTFMSNTDGVNAVNTLLIQNSISTAAVGLSFLDNGAVLLCQNIPGQVDSNCTTLVKRENNHMHVRELTLSFDDRASDRAVDSTADKQCAISLMWLGDVLTDARREDLVVLAYQIWLFSMSVMTLLNESLPHLFAGLAARALAMGWASFRVHGNMNLYTTYMHVITDGNCNGFNPPGVQGWWTASGPHEITGLVFNVVTFVLIAGLSYKLFRVYASQTFSRVGTSTEIHRLYKIVLLFSVILQLAGFFTIAQTSLWVGKISLGPIRQLAEHFHLYLAALAITAVLEVPWLVLGWISVRRESRVLFLLFAGISLMLFGMATAMFISPLYRFVLEEWSFYATISICSYVLLVATSVLAIVCRLKFGLGLAEFLRVADALDDGDFTPVYFTKGEECPTYNYNDDKKFDFDDDVTVLGYAYPKDTKSPKLPEPAASHGRKHSAFSVMLSDKQSPDGTIHLSSTPDLFRNGTLPHSSTPILVNPVERSSSITSSASSRSRAKIPAMPKLPIATLMASTSTTSKQPTETAEERVGRAETKEPTKPPQAAVRAGSVPRRTVAPGGLGLPRRPSDGSVSKPAGNFF